MKKNILFIETGSGFGGTGKYLFEFLKRIDKGLFNPFVIYSGEGANVGKIKKLSFPSKRINLSVENPDKGPFRYIVMLFWMICVAFPNSIRILFEIKKHNIDLVYLNNEILSHIPSIIAAKFLKRKIICHNHGLRKLTLLERMFSKCIDLFICVSYATKSEIVDSLPNKRIEVVHNGLDINDYKAIQIDEGLRNGKEGGKLVGMLGRIVAWKGHEVFIKAASDVLREHEDVFFVIIGDDITEEKRFLRELKAQILDFGISEKVIFTGWKDDPLSCVQCLDIVIQPSIEPEPFGLTVIESMALGKPVIGSCMGALPELIDHDINGLLFKPRDPDDLRDKINYLLSNEEVCLQMGIKAKKKVGEAFSIDRNVERVQDLIREILYQEK